MEKQQQQHNPHFPWKDRNSETWCQKQWPESCGMKLGFRWGRRRPGSSSWRCEEVVRDGIVEGERKTKNPKSERAMRMGFVDPWNAGEIWGERENGVGGGLERERKDGSRERKWVSWVKWGEEALLLLDGVGAAPALCLRVFNCCLVHSRFQRVAPTAPRWLSFCHVAVSGCVIEKSAFSCFLKSGMSAHVKGKWFI